MSYSQSFYVKPSQGEVIQTTVQLHRDVRPVLLGTVHSPQQQPIVGALVAVYLSDEVQDQPVTTCYTDAQGQFAVGTLEAGKLYHVRVIKSDDAMRALEQTQG